MGKNISIAGTTADGIVQKEMTSVWIIGYPRELLPPTSIIPVKERRSFFVVKSICLR